jgi:flavin-dependent dehydrogenase
MIDVLVVGAGPAGSLAAWRLASHGVRVMLVDREQFPRHKLCGDTLNPGAVALLRSLPLGDSPVEHSLPLAGMLVTGPHARVEARYGGDISGRAIERRIFDKWLLSRAIAAGVQFEDRVTVKLPITDSSGAEPRVRGVKATLHGSRREVEMSARLTLAADGRSSAIARALGLAWHPKAPRRWAFGTYASGVTDTHDLGEMHIRGRKYIGVAPLSSDLCNVCVVTGRPASGRAALDVVKSELQADPELRQRFARARFEAPVTVLGPLAVRARACGVNGVLLAGDAAGFVDPMTGDGLHLAMKGALLAADEILAALQSGDSQSAVRRLESARARAIGQKLRFNRLLRRLVEAPAAVGAASWAARVAPSAVRWAVRYAGDAA